jgi:hypothetical protein
MRYLSLLAAFAPMPALACTVGDPGGVPLMRKADVTTSAKARIADITYVELALQPSNNVRLAATPGKLPKPDSYAGLITLAVTRATILRIELSDTSYVDLVRARKALVALDHGHPDHSCTIMHKFVSFRVMPGRYVLQITSAPSTKVRLATKFIDG